MKADMIHRMIFAGAVLALAGCYNSVPPPRAFQAERFTAREHDSADELLKGIKTLTVYDAQRIAVQNNPSYTAAYHAVSAARMKFYQAIGAYSPVITAGFQLADQHNYNNDQHGLVMPSYARGYSTSSSVSASWLLFDGLAREFKLLSARASQRRQENLEEDACRLLLKGVVVAYNNVLLYDAKRNIAIEDRKFQDKNLKETELKYQAGAVPLSEVLNFQIKVNDAISSEYVAEYQYKVALFALAVLMGYPEGTLPDSVGFPPIDKDLTLQLPAVEVYLDNALANRPDLKSYREQLKIAEYQVYQGYSAYSPSANFFLEYGYYTNRYHKDSVPSYSAGPGLLYGINVNWTLFNGAIRYNQLRQYQAELAATGFDVAGQWLTVVQEVRDSYEHYMQSVRVAQIYEKTLVLVVKQRDLVEEEYKAGNTELTRLNEAQLTLVEAETTLVEAYVNVQNAKAQLDAAANINTAMWNRRNDDGESIVPSAKEVDTRNVPAPLPPPENAELDVRARRTAADKAKVDNAKSKQVQNAQTGIASPDAKSTKSAGTASASSGVPPTAAHGSKAVKPTASERTASQNAASQRQTSSLPAVSARTAAPATPGAPAVKPVAKPAGSTLRVDAPPDKISSQQ